MNFVQSHEVRRLAGYLPVPEGVHPRQVELAEAIFRDRRTVFIEAVTSAPDSDFRLALLRGVIANADFEREQDVYTATAFTAAADEEERHEAWHIVHENGRPLRADGKTLDVYGTAAVAKKVEDALHEDADQLIALDEEDIILGTIGYTLRALAEHAAVRQREKEIVDELSELE